MKRFHKVLIANRGEIALRILQTCRRLGLGTVGVFSAADADLLHAQLPDERVRLGPAPASASYLNVEALLEAARRTGADAVHPGYGFLAESAAFARAVEAAGLVFIGPRPETIERLGSKAGARVIMAAAGVPVVPGYDGADQSDEALLEAAARIGSPLLVKASAGGGGKGMTIVREGASVTDGLDQARRVARSAFGDDRLILERYVERPRHIEVQIFGDAHGRVIHLGERECSIQRRFQKVIEETPAPGLDPAVREALCQAAVAAGQAVDYLGAGTVEFIVAPDGGFYFLEVNARLQVEHRVTELVTGLDLVELQIRVARGESLEGVEAGAAGHAIEARLCAEDPAAGFAPSVGRLAAFYLGEPDPGCVDTGYEEGDVVGPHYDSLLAKLVAGADTRDAAVDALVAALERTAVLGVATNRGLLLDLARHPRFRAGELHTHFIAEHWPEGWRPSVTDPDVVTTMALMAALEAASERRLAAVHVPALRSGWRNNPWRPQEARYRVDGSEVRVEYESIAADAWRVRVGDGPWRRASLHTGAYGGRTLEVDGLRRDLDVEREGARTHVRLGAHALTFEAVPRFPETHAAAGGGAITPMPGKVVKVLVQPGDTVTTGAPLVILEAMKMEQTLTAPADGVVKAVRFAVGDFVEPGAVLVELE